MASIASWADQYRETPQGKWSEPFHFIDAEDNPPSSCNVDFQRDCGSKGCSISAIANYTQRVQDGRLAADQKYNALKFIIHFLGDITQPLHDEAYKVGGNQIKVRFDGYEDNLHSDWDTYIPEKIANGSSNLSVAKAWSEALIGEIDSGSFKSQAPGWIQGDSIDDIQTSATRWATDGNKYVCSVVMPNGEAALEQGDLYPDYYNSVAPTVELQIAKGGYRLANWLNMISKNDSKKKRDEAGGLISRKSLPDLSGRDLLPAPRPLSRAKIARMELGYNCNDHKH